MTLGFPTAGGTRRVSGRNYRAHFRAAEGINWSGIHMTKAIWRATTAAAAIVGFSAVSATTAYAQATGTGTVNVSVNVAAKAKLTLGSASLTFADADPDTTPTLTAPGLAVDVKARTTAAGNVTLTVLASGDLVSAGNPPIAISSLTWSSGSGNGFAANGVSNSTTPATVGSWTGSGQRAGTQVYSLPNSWTYATGTYATTLTYTLTAP
jgi:hypothetical protein